MLELEIDQSLHNSNHKQQVSRNMKFDCVGALELEAMRLKATYHVVLVFLVCLDALFTFSVLVFCLL